MASARLNTLIICAAVCDLWSTVVISFIVLCISRPQPNHCSLPPIYCSAYLCTSVYLPSLLHTYLNIIPVAVTGVSRCFIAALWCMAPGGTFSHVCLYCSMIWKYCVLCGRLRSDKTTVSRVAYRSLTEQHVINLFSHTCASLARWCWWARLLYAESV